MTTFLGIALIVAGVALGVFTGILYFFQLMAAHNGGNALKGVVGALAIAGLLGAGGIWLVRH